MIDFHSHILPGVDDGAQDVSESLALLRQSFLQGVDVMVASSHYYPDEECPKDFLKRRNRAFRQLQDAMLVSTEVYPKVVLGAEVLYFPGISEAEEVRSLVVGPGRCILVEPPIVPWSNSMLDEIAHLGENMNCLPVIAHVNRYMDILRDESLIDRVRERKMAVQVNASYFTNPKTVKKAIRNLKQGKIQLIGSDCHNLNTRPPNLGLAWKQAKAYHVEAEFRALRKNAIQLLVRRNENE